MRSVLMATASLLLTTGLAFAQTPSTMPGNTSPGMSTPMAQGSAMAPAGSSGTMGNATGTPSSMPGNTSPGMSTPMAQGSAMAPAGSTGAMGNQSGTPSVMPGNTSPGMGTAMPMHPPMHPKKLHHQMADAYHGGAMDMPHGGMMGMPAEGSATEYLKIAKTAIMQKKKMIAEEALGHAETRILTRSVPAGMGIEPDNSPMIQKIQMARQSLMANDMNGAMAGTDAALRMDMMHHDKMGGPMGGPAGGPMGGPGMAPPPKPNM
ncbi:MAG TPA: hypothetical protein PLC74_11130 [Acetobacteraceae bacterium]|nr:hypothetical protein [Acetobacteraceae bacterium]